MINRAAVMLKYKEPIIRWTNDSDPYDDNPGITLKSANKDRTVYLIQDNDAEKLEEWISINLRQFSKVNLKDGTPTNRYGRLN